MNNSQFRALLSEGSLSNAASNTNRPTRSDKPTTGTFARNRKLHSSGATYKRPSNPLAPAKAQANAKPSTSSGFKPRNLASAPGKPRTSSPASSANYNETTAKQKEEKRSRILALRTELEAGRIDENTFNTLCSAIGGDSDDEDEDGREEQEPRRGLDFEALRRAKVGASLGLHSGSGERDAEGSDDVDAALDDAAAATGNRVETPASAPRSEKQEVKKKGNLAIAGRKRTRDEIVAELKAARKAAAEEKERSQAQLLGQKFKRVGEKRGEGMSVEVDSRGREVLVFRDADGDVVKRMVRRKGEGDGERDGQGKLALSMPEVGKEVLGADVSVPGYVVRADESGSKRQQEEDDDDDHGGIFAGVGTEYNPLGDHEDEDDSDDTVDSDNANERQSTNKQTKPASTSTLEPLNGVGTATRPRNYFGDTSSTANVDSANPTHDSAARFAGVQDLLKKASRMQKAEDGASSDDESQSEEARERVAKLKRRAAELNVRDRDMEDMDMDFGRDGYAGAGDEDSEGEGKRVKLSEWKNGGPGDGNEDDGEQDGKRRQDKRKRTRPGKAKKGDKHSVDDVMKVLEGRRKSEGRK